jgi:predicted PurR-regulated permease PerM
MGPFSEKLLEALNQISVFIAERFETNRRTSCLFKNANNQFLQAFSFLRSSLYSLSESLFFLLIIPVFSALILYYRQDIKGIVSIFPADKRSS